MEGSRRVSSRERRSGRCSFTVDLTRDQLGCVDGSLCLRSVRV